MNAKELAAIKARHYRAVLGPNLVLERAREMCPTDGSAWPCEQSLLVVEVERLNVKLGVAEGVASATAAERDMLRVEVERLREERDSEAAAHVKTEGSLLAEARRLRDVAEALPDLMPYLEQEEVWKFIPEQRIAVLRTALAALGEGT